MQRNSRAVATVAVVAGLGGLAAVALASQPGGGSTTAATTQDPPRTRTIRRVEVHTITRVKRDLPPQTVRPAAAAPPVRATPAATPAATPVVQERPVSQPLHTRASGAPGAHGGEDGHEREHGDGKGGERDD